MSKSAFLLSELIRRDLSTRYAASFGGLLWAVLNPAILCVLYGFVFAVILKVAVPAGFTGTYTEFLLAGLLPWFGFQEAFMRGSSAIVEQAHLVKKLSFPVELLVASSLGAALVIQGAGLAVFCVFSLAAGDASISPGLLSLAFAFELLLLIGPVLIMSALHVFFRDLSQIFGQLLQVIFYLTPIVYPDSLIPKRLSALSDLNPIRDLVTLFRAALFHSPPPPTLRIGLWMLALGVLSVLALRFFRRCQRSFADLL